MSQPRAYYNEIDPFAAQWLRNLIAAGFLPAGDVDERSIVDVRLGDVAGYTQAHFFCGIGGWPYAARLAGWGDDRPLWTGSCPCQPFSVAGKGRGTDDPRHLWPHFFRLIRAVRPPVVMGEQVAGAAGYGWLDGVVADLEGEGYACRGVDIPACAVDAPHIRSRLYWVASEAVDDATGAQRARHAGPDEVGETRHGAWRAGFAGRGGDGGSRMADADRGLGDGRPDEPLGRPQRRDAHRRAGAVGDMADAAHGGWREERADGGRRGAGDSAQGRAAGFGAGRLDDADDAGLEGHAGHGSDRAGWPGAAGSASAAGGGDVADADHERRGGVGLLLRETEAGWHSSALPEAAGRGAGTFWSDAVWLTGADGKARRAQPGLPLLAHGIPGRVGRLRAYGNAIVPALAAEVIAAFMEAAE